MFPCHVHQDVAIKVYLGNEYREEIFVDYKKEVQIITILKLNESLLHRNPSV